MKHKGLEYYLNIDETRFTAPTREALDMYTEHFIRKVPFENIDVQNGVSISVEIAAIYDKVVNRQRGGFCYELNTLYRHYLVEKGFRAFNVSATVHTPDGGRSLPGSHMSTVVEIEGHYYIADVGFGERPLHVMPLLPQNQAQVVEDTMGIFRAVFVDDTYDRFEVQKWDSEAWKTKYEGDLTPKQLADFAENLVYNQTNPNSIFVKQLIVTKPTEKGHVTMSQHHLTLTEEGQKYKKEITPDNYRTLLKKYFNIDSVIHRLEGPYK
ncbi:arylamine N-acetyltransferase family protein [Staphylococcus ratti]|uniref:Arylamine N-acetyltransferase n=1 Tax=Staphylococcus ratti TaxID=2892440 RepID=A0ABY3PDG1_9STAP|nr:arylamine N-acetyltransferase [Staphylococcus ratti]UEX90275.1 arylamine N-acetyltransferase [Staphylococcus ratti]